MSQPKIYFTLLLALCFAGAFAQKKKNALPNTQALKTEAQASIQQQYPLYKETALKIWDYAEVGYKEVKSSALLQELLRNNGFSVEAGVADIPTAFVATYGSGQPVIGILAEYDALPGLSQTAQPEKQAVTGRDAGHGCGHHLFGTASVAAGIAIKQLMQAGKLSGTVKVFGTPAEEGGSGKVYMVRAGLFDGVDAVIHWHPGNANSTSAGSSLANITAKFRFRGIASHAAASPERGRSALDGVEAMNMMVNMMREHVPSDARIHYIITSGGKAPNVVPDFAEVYYYVRHPDREVVRSIFERVKKAANGAALGTETNVDFEIIGGVYDLLGNHALTQRMYQNMLQVGGVSYTAEEEAYAQKIQATFGYQAPQIGSAANIQPLRDLDGFAGGGSTDVGDVSWAVPTVGMSAATWVPGTAAHSWQAVACGGTEIGTKGMMVAAKSMALMGIDLLTDAALRQEAKAEFERARGQSFQYQPLLGERKPALNYRDLD